MIAYRYAGHPVKLHATNEDFFIEKEGKFLCRVKKSEVQKARLTRVKTRPVKLK